MRVSQISGVVLTILLLCFQQHMVKGCDPGWFGPECQYLNHCSNPDCDIDLARVNDLVCAQSWFGPGCQYVDLVPSCQIYGQAKITGERTMITNLGETCQTDPPANQHLHSISVDLARPYVVTWIRIHASRHNASFQIALKFGLLVIPRCKQVRRTQTVVDIYCDMEQAAHGVNISGPDVGSICSVSVSGGRNVALKQETWQSTTAAYNDTFLESWRAVDGNTNGYLRNTQRSCSNTDSSDKNPTWGLKFKSPKVIYQFILHNRDVQSLLIRLKGFTLTFYSEDNATLFVYTDREDTPLEEYIVPLTFPIKRVNSVQIRAVPQLNDKNQTATILSLCEVEIFGDSLCPRGTFGLECELQCKCGVRNATCEDTCEPSCIVSQCCNQCLEGEQLTDQTEISIFVWVGIGIAAVVIIIIIVVIVAIWSCRRKNKVKYDKPHIYDVTNSNGQYNHDYNVLFRPDTLTDETRVKTNDETGLKTIDKESQIYDEVEEQYMEFE